ncbi:hypothetical protein DPMN_073511 [Dreissena polymorpha]|uniref:Uncharacterized protein n=1 Tax=Dreissena polymorpha TaxID=45954 RepID=A0A9D4HDI3_DREPO|nr:hypothetical protein DPMN_073511 [Dreissena polymorpha]
MELRSKKDQMVQASEHDINLFSFQAHSPLQHIYSIRFSTTSNDTQLQYAQTTFSNSNELEFYIDMNARQFSEKPPSLGRGGGFAPLDPYQDYALHPPEVLAAPLDHQQNFEYPAPHPKPEIPDPPLWTGSKIPIFSDMIICRRSQNPFLPSCLRALSKSVSARLSGQAMYHFPHTD